MAEKMKTGYMPRDYSKQPMGSIPCTAPFDLPLIPRDEWKDRIDALDEQNASILDVQDAAGIKALSQGNYGYCWSYGTCQAFMLIRAAAGLPHANLNPHALAALVKNFRDQGGNTFDAIPWLAEHGCPTYDTWPKYSMDRSLANSDVVKKDALQYRLTEWYELEPNNLDQTATCLLNGIPVTVGYIHLAHMMAAEKLIYRTRGSSVEYGIAMLNSWGPTSGDKSDGRMYLWGRKAISFDQAAPRVSTANV